jgi:hypothetical protein
MASDVESRVEEAVAKLDSGTKLLVRRELERLPGLLAAGEEILHMAHGRHGKGQGLVLTTDRRFMFLEDEIVRREVVDIPYEAISSVSPEVNVVKSDLTVGGPGAEIVINRIYPKDQTVEIAEDIRRRMSGAPGHRPEPELE